MTDNKKLFFVLKRSEVDPKEKSYHYHNAKEKTYLLVLV